MNIELRCPHCGGPVVDAFGTNGKEAGGGENIRPEDCPHCAGYADLFGCHRPDCENDTWYTIKNGEFVEAG
jgi:hypothetical protein